MSEIQVRTAAWYGDELLHLPVPSEWHIQTLWPRTPAPLTDGEIVALLEQPVGQPSIRVLCRGRQRPLIVVDDLNRPTPVPRILPVLLEWFQQASIEPSQVRILIASGTHAPPDKDAIARKLGPDVAARCQVIVHDPKQNLAVVGKTSFGTPIAVNREVLDSDFIVGIGGVYPNHSAGFGGGSKLALGVLGFRSILHLHYRHRPARWGAAMETNTFRADLDEIARAVGLRTMISAYVNADRQLVHLLCGDHFLYYPDAVAFAREVYAAPEPDRADVVIANAYPSDVSLTFAKMKGFGPLAHCAPGATRVAIASCSQGLGRHDLFPIDPSRLDRARALVRWASVRNPAEVAVRVASRIRRGARAAAANPATSFQNPIWMYRPGAHAGTLASSGLVLAESWPEIVRAVQQEQNPKRNLEVCLYPCAAIQFLEPASQDRSDAAPESVAVGSRPA